MAKRTTFNQTYEYEGTDYSGSRRYRGESEEMAGVWAGEYGDVRAHPTGFKPQLSQAQLDRGNNYGRWASPGPAGDYQSPARGVTGGNVLSPRQHNWIAEEMDSPMGRALHSARVQGYLGAVTGRINYGGND